jgi:hypothetical protein
LRFLKLFRLDFFPAPGKTGAAFLVSVLVVAGSLLGPLLSRPGGLERRVLDAYSSDAQRMAHEAQDGGEEFGSILRDYGRTQPDLLLVKREASPLYSRYDALHYKRYYGAADYLHLRGRDMDFYFSLKPLLAEDARRSISYFCVLMALFPAFFIYSRIRKKL